MTGTLGVGGLIGSKFLFSGPQETLNNTQVLGGGDVIIPQYFSGTIVNNSDKLENGYVGVQIDARDDRFSADMVWANYIFPYAGQNGEGMFCIPPVGSKCLLLCTDSSFNNPIILGNYYIMTGDPSQESGTTKSVVEKTDANLTKASENTENTARANEQQVDTLVRIQETKKTTAQDAIWAAYTSETGQAPTSTTDLGAELKQSLTVNRTQPISTTTVDAAVSLAQPEVQPTVRQALTSGTAQQNGEAVFNYIGDAAQGVVSGVNSASKFVKPSPAGIVGKANAINDTKLGKLASSQIDSLSKMAGDKLAGYLMGEAQQLMGEQLAQLDATIIKVSMQITRLMSAINTLCSLIGVKSYIKNAQAIALSSQIQSFTNMVMSVSTTLQQGMVQAMMGMLGEASKMMVDGAFNLVAGQLGDLSKQFEGLEKDIQGAIAGKGAFIADVLNGADQLAKTVNQYSDIAKAALDVAGAATDIVDPDMASQITAVGNNLINKAGDPGRVMEEMIKNGAGVISPNALGSFQSTISGLAGSNNSVVIKNMFNPSSLSGIKQYYDHVNDMITIGKDVTEGKTGKAEGLSIIKSPVPSAATAKAQEIRERKVVTGS